MVCIGVGSTLNASVTLAAPAAAALAVQAAAAAVKAANAATEATLEAAVRSSEKLVAEGDKQFEAETTSRRWHMAASEAVGMNATIRTLTVGARRAGVAVKLPDPVALNGRSLDEVMTWLVSAAPKVERAREEVARASIATGRDRLMAELPITVDRTSIDQALRRYQETLTRPASRSTPERHADLSWVDPEIHKVLAGLDADATAADREMALAAAGRVVTQNDDADADALLGALDRLVKKKINPRVAAARLAARWLEGLDQRVVADAVAADPTLPAAAVARELADVVTGSTELTPELTGRAQVAMRWATDLARVAYRADLLCTLLSDRGYNVSADGEGRLRVGRADWFGEHAATVWLDRDGVVHHLLVAAAQSGGDDAAARNGARDAELGRAVADAVHDMTHDGVHGLFVRAHDVQYQRGDQENTGTSAVGHPAPRARRVGDH